MLCIAESGCGGSVTFCWPDDCCMALDSPAAACCKTPPPVLGKDATAEPAIGPRRPTPRVGNSSAIARMAAHAWQFIKRVSPRRRRTRGLPAAPTLSTVPSRICALQASLIRAIAPRATRRFRPCRKGLNKCVEGR